MKDLNNQRLSNLKLKESGNTHVIKSRGILIHVVRVKLFLEAMQSHAVSVR
jgi:hypothetical protein